MKVAVLTATKRYGGLDVTLESLRRQTYKDFVWFCYDELFDERLEVFHDRCCEDRIRFSYNKPEAKPEGYYSNLPAIYNSMIEEALWEGCELAVSLQDYICIQSNGIEQFVVAHEENPRALLTGVCSMLRYPDASCVKDREGLWTVFDGPWPGPGLENWDEIEWVDVRSLRHGASLNRAGPIEWEMNWSAFPLDTEVRFDEEYGEHIGHENQQFAWTCMNREDRPILVQSSNRAYSFPHRHYFPEEWEEQQPHREANQEMHLSKFGGIERLRAGEMR